jgi:hypothetical protein
MYWMPNGRWRSVLMGENETTSIPSLIFTPNVWEKGFTLFFIAPLPPSNAVSRLVFIKPTGMWLKIPSTDFYLGYGGIPGENDTFGYDLTWAAYTFGHYEISEGGTWRVYLEINQHAGQIGTFPVNGEGYEVGALPADVLTSGGVPLTDDVGRFLTT